MKEGDKIWGIHKSAFMDMWSISHGDIFRIDDDKIRIKVYFNESRGAYEISEVLIKNIYNSEGEARKAFEENKKFKEENDNNSAWKAWQEYVAKKLIEFENEKKKSEEI